MSTAKRKRKEMVRHRLDVRFAASDLALLELTIKTAKQRRLNASDIVREALTHYFNFATGAVASATPATHTNGMNIPKGESFFGPR